MDKIALEELEDVKRKIREREANLADVGANLADVEKELRDERKLSKAEIARGMCYFGVDASSRM